MKTCSSCQRIKPLTGFSKNRVSKDGHQGQCKICRHAIQKLAREKQDQGHLKRLWGKNMRKYLDSPKGKETRKETFAKYKQDFPQKRKANCLVGAALKSGRIKRSSCEICGELRTEAHHPDYLKPLEIMWLCAVHHKAWHRVFKAEDCHINRLEGK